jgi:hypothetical protein
MVGLLVVALVFVAFVTWAIGEDQPSRQVIVAVGLAAPREQRERDFHTVEEEVLSRVPAGARVVVLGISDRNFSAPLLLDARLAGDGGLFGERLRAGQARLRDVWRERTRALPIPAANDVLGAFLRAAVIQEAVPGVPTDLIAVSNMRHVGNRYDFEKSGGLFPDTLERVARDGLIPSLRGVRVSALGVDAEGWSEQRWLTLRNFWQAYFRKSGAELVMYTPDRRWK